MTIDLHDVFFGCFMCIGVIMGYIMNNMKEQCQCCCHRFSTRSCLVGGLKQFPLQYLGMVGGLTSISFRRLKPSTAYCWMEMFAHDFCPIIAVVYLQQWQCPHWQSIGRLFMLQFVSNWYQMVDGASMFNYVHVFYFVFLLVVRCVDTRHSNYQYLTNNQKSSRKARCE